MSYCPNCGKETGGHNKFCANCGNSLETSAQVKDMAQNKTEYHIVGISSLASIALIVLMFLELFSSPLYVRVNALGNKFPTDFTLYKLMRESPGIAGPALTVFAGFLFIFGAACMIAHAIYLYNVGRRHESNNFGRFAFWATAGFSVAALISVFVLNIIYADKYHMGETFLDFTWVYYAILIVSVGVSVLVFFKPRRK